MIDIAPQKIRSFQKHLLSWYATHKRDLPWRNLPDNIGPNQRAYMILVSEVMSQQTQLSRVIPRYLEWMKRFPTLQSLSQAPVSEVLLLWSGLGYNRRAIFLHQACHTIADTYQGIFPDNETILRTLPGIGAYTARAVLCFALNHQVSVVDTNVTKVIMHEFGITRITPKEISRIADMLLPENNAAEWNQALMDYAALTLSKIPHPIVRKQSPFRTSNRYYRGMLIKNLLKNSPLSVSKLEDLWHDIPPPRRQTILHDMQKDGIISFNHGTIRLPG